MGENTKCDIWADFSFEAAHSLPIGIPSRERVHGHSFKCRVTISGEASPDYAGTVWPAEMLQERAREVAAPLDHAMLNDIDDLTPTNEGLAAWIARRLALCLPDHCTLKSVEVWRETCGIGAKWVK